MIKLIGIIVYLAIGVAIGIQMYEERSLDEERDWYDILWLAIGSSIWLITLMIAIVYDECKQLKKESNEKA